MTARLQDLLTTRMVGQEQARGTRVSKLDDSNPLKKRNCCLVHRNPQGAECTQSLLVRNYTAHCKPAQLHPRDAEAACGTHLFSEQLEGEIVLKHLGICGRAYTYKTAKLLNNLNQGLSSFICWLCLNQIMCSTNLKKLNKYNSTAGC